MLTAVNLKTPYEVGTSIILILHMGIHRQTEVTNGVGADQIQRIWNKSAHA